VKVVVEKWYEECPNSSEEEWVWQVRD